MKTKIAAFYLPQFHEVEENNLWWGKGFTEWSNVKNARPLYDTHYQPRKPLNNNYYNLMDKSVVEWQTELSHKYGVDVFAYYHYWFNGKLLLEKPAENLLKWTDIPQEFFFFWANHTWYKASKGEKEYLQVQEYGGQTDWLNHYNYMKAFFKDDRYVKIDNCPVVGIYMPKDIPGYDDMVRYWRKLAKEDGFNGIYVIESINAIDQKCHSREADAVVLRQPNISKSEEGAAKATFMTKVRNYLCKKFRLHNLRRSDYADIAKFEENIDFDKFKKYDEKIYACISTGWDNTPRHGRYGHAFDNLSPVIFGQTFSRLYKKSVESKNEFLFINAWNEWAEGMYLEPDEKFRYEYLEAIKNAITGS
jgi:hypothetical protein